MENVEICRRVDALKMARSTIEAIWNDVEKYIMPLRMGNMYIQDIAETAVRLIRDDVYDSTGIFAAQRMANAMHGTITNANVKWRSRLFKKDDLNKDPDSREWLADADNIEWEALYDSNFDAEISSCYQDLVGPGNCFLSVMAENDSPKDWAGFNFTAMPLKESFFERDHRGDLYHSYRWMKWRASEIRTKWPEMTLPERVMKELSTGGDPDYRFDIIYAIFPREGKKDTGQVMAVSERPWVGRYVFKDTAMTLGPEEGYYQMPVMHCPYEKTSGSMWGHGPGMLMAPTVKYINFWLELEDMAVRKIIDPAVLTQERGVISDLQLGPGGVTVVRNMDAVKVFESGGKIDFSKMSLKELRDAVQQAFHNDELQLRDSPQMSATEAQIRYELMNRVLGPTMGRIQYSLLSKMLDRTFKTLYRNQQFKPLPDAVRQSDSQLKVVYTGALMRSQMTDEVAAIERWLGQVGGIAKVMPQVLNVVDIIEVARQMALKLNIPAKMLRSVKEVEALVQQQKQVAAAQARSSLMQQDGDAKKAQGEGAQAVQQAQQQ